MIAETAPGADSETQIIGRVLVRGTLFGLCAAVAAPVLSLLDHRAVEQSIVFAIGGVGTAAAWIAGWWTVAKARHSHAAFLCAAALASFAAILAPQYGPSWDYLAYQQTAAHLTAGTNPWAADTTTNPPLHGQVLGLAFQAVGTVAPSMTPERAWFWVFYLHQWIQQGLLALLLWFSLAIARRSGLATREAAVVVVLMLALNAPLRETLYLHQLNLLVLVLIVGAIELAPRRAAAAGALAAAGVLAKLYPLVVFAIWLTERRWKPLLAGALAASAMIVAGGRGWAQYFDYLQAFERPTFVRDASLHSLISNVARLGGVDRDWQGPISVTLWIAASVAVGGWVLIERRRAATAGGHLDNWALVAVTPIVFPLAWAHHFLLVTPLAIGLVSLALVRQRPLALLASSAALVIPAFEVFPLGLVRLSGALALLVVWAGVRRA